MTVESSGTKSDESKAAAAPAGGDVRFPRWLPALAAAFARRAARSSVDRDDRPKSPSADRPVPSVPSPEETLP